LKERNRQKAKKIFVEALEGLEGKRDEKK